MHAHPKVAGSCLVCESTDLVEVDGFAELPRITSDCRAFPAGGRLFVCRECGAVQKQATARWREEISAIYAHYASYYQSGGEEQIVFDRRSGRPRRRSDVLVERLGAETALPVEGAALDVGCGNGVTLRSMSAGFPRWSLSGYELGDSALPELAAIPRFARFYTGSLSAVEGAFDLVTMIHSLEHFPSPREVLQQLREIVGTGLLFIQVCDVEQNPFDILVADHLLHFSPASLRRLLQRAGFSVDRLATDWVPKEISLLGRRAPAGEDQPGPFHRAGSAGAPGIAAAVQWLRELTARARQLTGGGQPLGIFGTSIAATWLGSQMHGKISFFVDEDESRVGKSHLGRPILRPADVPKDSVVYLALAPAVAELVAGKLSSLPLTLVLPPRLAQSEEGACGPGGKRSGGHNS